MSENGTTAPAPELVGVEIDGNSVSVPKGTNLIEAAKQAGIEVPFYCYHPHLSVPGNCRMCQLEVEGAPKLMIGCHTQVQEGMKIRTQQTSQQVKDAQAATLEFILINHPLDCTVCDQAGHCKLQDYHYEYNARPSRFLEDKVKKVKAQPLGPTVILDGERCIMCTRCIRFCDEITGTSELGMLNRGDRSEIAVNPGKELNNPLSGTVVDLCPVGALTHREWRFNTRIWYTKQTDSICPGCSTGCNVKVATRDNEIVQVKARMNDHVNKEWLCDEGRYGFPRFLPTERVIEPSLDGAAVDWDTVLAAMKKLKDSNPLVFVAPDLLLEEYIVLREFLDRVVKKYQIALGYKERDLTAVEKILISPDYAPNFRGAEFARLVDGSLTARYNETISRLRGGSVESVLLIGDRAIDSRDIDVAVLSGLSQAAQSAGILTDAAGQLASATKLVLPGRSILEKSGCLINRAQRLQYSDRLVDFPDGTEPEWRLINRIAEHCGVSITDAETDRDLTIAILDSDERLAGLTIKKIKAGGISLSALSSAGHGGATEQGTGAPV